MTLIVTPARTSDARRLDVGVKLHNAKAFRGLQKLTAKIVAERTMKQLDKNGDGKLHKSEVPLRFRGRIFTLLDTNKDGVIDLQELHGLASLR